MAGEAGEHHPDVGATAVPQAIAEQGVSRLLLAGAIHGEHVVIFSKILDLNYEIDRKTISLVQSLGVREVTSKSGQAGVPLAGGAA